MFSVSQQIVSKHKVSQRRVLFLHLQIQSDLRRIISTRLSVDLSCVDPTSDDSTTTVDVFHRGNVVPSMIILITRLDIVTAS